MAFMSIVSAFILWVKDTMQNKRVHHNEDGFDESAIKSKDFLKIHDWCTITAKEMNADRLQIWLFHNGEKYYHWKDIVKFSCEWEVVPKIKSTKKELQGVNVSVIFPSALPIFGEENEVDGMSIHYFDKKGNETSEQQQKQKVYYFCTQEMEESGLKSIMVTTHVTGFAMCPIASPDGRYYGIVCGQWADNDYNEPCCTPVNLSSIECLANNMLTEIEIKPSRRLITSAHKPIKEN